MASTTGSQDAQALARRLAGRKSHVNLIPYNPVAGLPVRAAGPRGDPPVRGTLRGPGRERDGPQDQGPGHRRGLRPAPPPAGRRTRDAVRPAADSAVMQISSERRFR